MSMTTLQIPVPKGKLPINVRIVMGDSIQKGDVFVSCVLDAGGVENLDIPLWPKYHRNNQPSKHLPAADLGDVRDLPALGVPDDQDPKLTMSLHSRKRMNWNRWKAIFYVETQQGPIVWTMDFRSAR